MDETLNEKTEISLFKKLIPYAALAILLSVSVGVWRFYENLSERREQRRFGMSVETVVYKITERLERYKMILQGLGGVFASSDEVDRAEFKVYYGYRQIDALYKGIESVGYARVVQPWELSQHVQEIRAEGFPGYTVHPAGEREVYVPVIFIAPHEERNRHTFGFDLFSEPVHRETITRARDTGAFSMSGKVVLTLHTDQDIHPGFLLYLPIFRKDMSLYTVGKRKAAIKGYVLGVFRINDFIQGVLPDGNPDIYFKLYDGTEVSSAALMYDSRGSTGAPGKKSTPVYAKQKTLDLYGHQWTLAFETTPAFETAMDRHTAKTVLGGGVATSLLIFLLLKVMETTGKQAFSLAREMTSALRESEERFRLLAENSADVVWTTDLEGRLTYISPAIENLIGYTPEEVMAMPMTGYIIQEDYEAIMARLAEELAKPPAERARSQTLEVRYKTKDGRLVPVEFSSSWLLDNEGNVVGVQGSTRDITARKEADAQAAAERQRLYSVLEAMPAFVALIGSDYSLHYVNREFRDRFGDPAGRKCHEALFERDRECDNCRTFEVLRSGAPVIWEWTGPDGRIYQIYDYPYTDTDGTSMVLELGLDINEQKQAEANRIARKAAEAASRQKSLFLSNMSHEIRTPMNAILGFAQILERDPSLTSRQVEQVRAINRSGNHLLRLIGDILDISKIEAGRIELRSAVFRLGDLLDDLEMMFRSRADAKKLQLLMERDAGIPPYVLGDDARLRQVLVNLLGNAVKFTERGGVSVRVRSEPVEVKPEGDKKSLRLVFEVEDSGPGIPESDLGRIFDAFRQSETGIKAGGTGLGLAISRKLVKMMGGSLTVESAVGEGSCFRFDVLCEPAEAEPNVAETEPTRRVVGLEPGTGPWRVLVVDDIATNRDLLREMLRPLGFELREAENGAEAIELFEVWSPHAVLMDMRMPVMDGYEATRRIKTTEAGRTTPVIAVTASAFKDSEEEVLATGVSAYLRKPFKPEEIYEALGKFLDLRYVYADEPASAPNQPKAPALTPKSLAALPRELVRAMRDAVAEGDMAWLAELIRQVEPLDRAAARGLKTLADRYDYTTLDELLAKGENGNG